MVVYKVSSDGVPNVSKFLKIIINIEVFVFLSRRLAYDVRK